MGMRPIRFKWIEWNVEKLAAHRISPTEAEEVLRSDPDVAIGHSGAFVAEGQTKSGRYLEVVFVWDEPSEVDAIELPGEAVVFVITAYDMTKKRKKAHRRRQRRH
jgi:hypothetical protein